MLICAHAFHMTFTDYSQVPPNCNQSLTVILTQARLLYKGGAGAPIKDFMCASAWVLSHQMTASARSSNSVRASLALAAGEDSVTETDICMLMNAVQQFTEVVATAVSILFTCLSHLCH